MIVVPEMWKEKDLLMQSKLHGWNKGCTLAFIQTMR